MDDLRLVERMRQGDAAAFGELFERYQTPVFRYAVHMCGAADADDVVQETFLALLRRLEGYDPARGSVLGYLLGIARHRVFKRLGERRRGSPSDDFGGGVAGIAPRNPLEELSRGETIALVREAVRTLPPAYREVIVLCELNGIDYRAAASIIGCPIGTVRSRLHRARAMLTNALASAGPEAKTANAAQAR